MKCNEIRELLSLYIDQMLDDNQMKEVEEHLAICAACKKEYVELKEITELLGQIDEVPVPESFDFRLKKALKEEKQSMAACAAKEKASKKSKWRVLTSIAAVFTVGLISFGLYHDVLGILPDKLNGGDQAAVKQVEELYGTNSDESTELDQSINVTKAAMKSSDLQSDQQTADHEALEISQNNNIEIQKPKSAEESSVAETNDLGVTMYGLADDGDSSSEESAGASADTSALPEGFVSASEAENIAATNRKASPEVGCSRSLTASGVERNVAAVHFYDNLIQEELDGFEYQILDSNYIQTGEWHFRVFIFRGKDGNTYNEEIMIIGKDGEIKVICSNEFMGL